MFKRLGILFVLFQILGAYNLYADNLITIVKPDGSTFYATDVKEAVAIASSGATLYLSAGSYDVDGMQIQKTLHIIGAGYNPKSTGATGQTVFTGVFRLITGADNGSIQGIMFTNEVKFGTGTGNQEVDNYTFSRCYFQHLFLSYGWNTSQKSGGITVSECIIMGSVFGGNTKDVVIRKCIIKQTVLLNRMFTLLKNAVVENCILMPMDANANNTVVGTIFRNNIITYRNFDYVNSYSENILLNNLHCEQSGLNSKGVTTINGNVYIEREKIFKNAPKDFIDFDFDYTLTDAAIDAIKGTDGTQVGIFGSPNPFKAGGLPPNPHIDKAKIETVTGSDGKLKIEFNVKSQSK